MRHGAVDLGVDETSVTGSWDQEQVDTDGIDRWSDLDVQYGQYVDITS